ncbi:hypothetical protein O1611_g8793 [Lasiodiplodia mahajangana]|uniref:Uncharacterized protein n=1 Tax=Lasiodiplodia mahajangana TaxID=1108764 RepID=A0ACC2JBU6_9PEZI|nr:hypothetical protein O1611_g8793 [Lasiodiplodia mahajangana]
MQRRTSPPARSRSRERQRPTRTSSYASSADGEGVVGGAELSLDGQSTGSIQGEAQRASPAKLPNSTFGWAQDPEGCLAEYECLSGLEDRISAADSLWECG